MQLSPAVQQIPSCMNTLYVTSATSQLTTSMHNPGQNYTAPVSKSISVSCIEASGNACTPFNTLPTTGINQGPPLIGLKTSASPVDMF